MIYFIQEPISGLIKIGHATEPFMTRRPIHHIAFPRDPHATSGRETWATRLITLGGLVIPWAFIAAVFVALAVKG